MRTCYDVGFLGRDRLPDVACNIGETLGVFTIVLGDNENHAHPVGPELVALSNDHSRAHR